MRQKVPPFRVLCGRGFPARLADASQAGGDSLSGYFVVEGSLPAWLTPVRQAGIPFPGTDTE